MAPLVFNFRRTPPPPRTIPAPSPPAYNPHDTHPTLTTSFTEKPRPWSQTYETHNGLSQPKPPRTRTDLLSLSISRSRFIIRLLSAILSTTGLALAISSLRAFNKTSSHSLLYNGEPLWPEHTNLSAHNALLAVFAVCSVVSVGVLAAGVHPRVRRVTRLGGAVALSAGATNLVLAVAGSVYFWMWRGREGEESLRSWTCARRETRHPDVDFGMVCDEERYGFVLGMMVVGVEVLTVLTVVAGFIFVSTDAKEVVGRHTRSRSRDGAV